MAAAAILKNQNQKSPYLGRYYVTKSFVVNLFDCTALTVEETSVKIDYVNHFKFWSV